MFSDQKAVRTHARRAPPQHDRIERPRQERRQRQHVTDVEREAEQRLETASADDHQCPDQCKSDADELARPDHDTEHGERQEEDQDRRRGVEGGSI